MSHVHSHDQTVPRPALLAAAGVVGLSLLLTVLVRVGVLSPEAVPAVERAQAQVSAAETYRLVFVDRADGAVAVRNTDTGRTVAIVTSTTPSNGFIRGVLRGLARDRRARGIGAEPPFALTRWSDGSLSLVDTATRRSIELGGFGPDNTAAFAALLKAARN